MIMSLKLRDITGILVIFLSLLFLFSCKEKQDDSVINYKVKVISYIRTWELKKVNGKRVFWKADDIEGSLLTDLNIAFAEIRNGSEIFISSVEWDDGFYDLFDQIKEVKRRYPALKVNLSIGGWGADGFSDVAYYENLRRKFVENVIEWIEKYGFDGVDIDWEYPVNGADGLIKSRPSDRKNFTKLMSELKEALDKAGKKLSKKLTLSFAGGAFSAYLDWIEPGKLADIVDYVNLMGYDFYGEWSETTGHHSNLYKSIYENENLSVNIAVNDYISAGFAPGKIVVGVPFFGRAWKGVSNVNNGLYQKYERAIYTSGLGYKDIVNLIKAYTLKKYWDDTAKSPYLYNGDIWISYDDKQALEIKVDYVKEKGLGGVMIWEYTQDFENELLKTINQRIKAKYFKGKR